MELLVYETLIFNLHIYIYNAQCQISIHETINFCIRKVVYKSCFDISSVALHFALLHNTKVMTRI